MENIMELEIARQVCVRKLDNLTRAITGLTKKKQSIESYEKEDKKQVDELVKEAEKWQKRCAVIDDNMYKLVEESF